MKMCLFPAMGDTFWLSLNIFTVQSRLHISRRDTRAETKDLPQLISFFFSLAGGSSRSSTQAKPRLRCFKHFFFFFVQTTWQSFIFHQVQLVRFAAAWCRRLVRVPPRPPYLPLLKIKEWIWMNNFLSVCQEMMCGKKACCQNWTDKRWHAERVWRESKKVFKYQQRHVNGPSGCAEVCQHQSESVGEDVLSLNTGHWVESREQCSSFGSYMESCHHIH